MAGAIGVLGLLGAGAAARAELVILADGDVVKVKAFELVGEQQARLILPSGGRMTLAITRVERVVDDEVAPEPDPPPALQGSAPAQAAAIPLRFDAAQAVPEGPWGALIYEAARRHGLNPGVIAAVIHAESAGNPWAVSRVGARGLMQLMPATAERFGIRHSQLFDPQQNLEAGSRYLAWLLDQFPNDLARILAAYNAGENAVARYGGIPPYRETRGYVRRIYANLGLAFAVEPVPSLPPPQLASSTAPTSR
ncbi:MAG TPA: lytic transglycosylase domain-containing protein [Thermoanaerobaculia bacterium]|nr:lytic transglycosylase domain-containing protein [Thermoanaerobaculia bacterium]